MTHHCSCFYPRSPCGERPRRTYQQGAGQAFLSTLSLRRATALGLPGWLRVLVSIHALLAESDQGTTGRINGRISFYPRSPCGERHILGNLFYRRFCFYPRSPCGERRGGHINKARGKRFYPRSPCGERREVIAVMTDAQSVSIHALLAESDRTAYF